MTIIGALAAGVSLASLLIAARRGSRVERWIGAAAWAGRARHDRRRVRPLPIVRVAGALCGATIGACCGWLIANPLPIVIAAYAGALAPALLNERRAAARVRDAERACVTLVEWLCALVAAGRPVESAIAALTARGSGSALLEASLARVGRDYTLGVPLHVALSREGVSSGIRGLSDLGSRLERARVLGRGALPLLDGLRQDLRAAERSRALRAASGVEGKLTLVMTLCYLPALALLVIVPLFLTLLNGLFA